jgi:uncharacterized protein YndB with AHSA1/START domain
MNVTDSTTQLVKEITIDAPAERVFAALTEPAQLTQWWGDDGSYHTEHMTADVRVGGKWRTTGTTSKGEAFAVEGEYRVIERPHLLEYTWKHDWGERREQPTTTVRFELTERNGQTHLRLTHSGFTDVTSRDDHNTGWGTVLGWLKRFAE